MSNTFYMRHIGNPEAVCSAVIIPAKDESQPDWLTNCGLIYSEDGKRAGISGGCGLISGRVGYDIVVFWGYAQDGTPMVDIIHEGTQKHRALEICHEDGTL